MLRIRIPLRLYPRLLVDIELLSATDSRPMKVLCYYFWPWASGCPVSVLIDGCRSFTKSGNHTMVFSFPGPCFCVVLAASLLCFCYGRDRLATTSRFKLHLSAIDSPKLARACLRPEDGIHAVTKSLLRRSFIGFGFWSKTSPLGRCSLSHSWLWFGVHGEGQPSW